MMRSVRVLAALSILLVARGLVAADLSDAVARLTSAFGGSSARELRDVLPADKKVFLALPAVHDEERHFGPDQVFYLFDAFFAKNRTVAFCIGKDAVTRTERTANAHARWRYESAGKALTQPLDLVLTEEDGRWVVTEIRAGRN
jgi:hypothetical protein